jgi:PAS domain S-box-containing protein
VGTLLLVVCCGIAAIMRGARAALGLVALGVALLAVVGYAMVQGLIIVAPERALTSLSPGAWVVTAATFVSLTAGLILPLQALSTRVAESCRRLERQTRRTGRSNERLRAEVRRRKTAEKALRSSELRYRGIFESASVGIMEEDLSGVRAVIDELRASGVEELRSHLVEHPEVVARAAATVQVRDVNQAAFQTYGASSKEQLLQSLDRIFVAESLDGFREVILALADGRPSFRGEAVNRTLRGERIHVLLQASIPEDPRASVLVSVLDITDRKLLEQSLADARKMEAIGTLAGGIAHDFNNLLMGIRGYATLLRRSPGEPADEHSYLDSIDQLVDSGAALTGQLLGFARGGKYNLQTTDLRLLLTASLSIFGRTRKEVEIQQRLATDLWTVDVDRTQVEQVMLNLYVNAWQAMPRGGQLYVDAANVTLGAGASEGRSLPSGDYVQISVRDTGIGMDEATCSRVFEPFFTTKELGRGTGLGLASAYAIIANHGGTIEVTSQPGAGSTFVVYLPASKRPVAPRVTPVPTTQPGTETVLLVDDEPSLRRSTGLMLEELGYRVLTAADGHEALLCFDTMPDAISVVILDMIMPGMGGAETFERLRARARALPILLSSGYSQDARAEALLRTGPTAFLQKPFRLETLSQKLRLLIDERAARSS